MESGEQVGAGIQVPPNSARILQRFGVLDEIRQHSVVPHAFILRSYRGHEVNRQPMLPFCEQAYGAPYLQIHRADFHSALVRRARALGAKSTLLLASLPPPCLPPPSCPPPPCLPPSPPPSLLAPLLPPLPPPSPLASPASPASSTLPCCLPCRVRLSWRYGADGGPQSNSARAWTQSTFRRRP